MKAFFPQTAAFSLVEVTLALGATAFCMIAVFGLLPIGLKSNQAASEQTAASGILSAVAADLRAAPPTFPRGQSISSEQFLIPIPANPVPNSSDSTTLYFSSNGTSSSTPNGDARYRLTVSFPPNGANAKAATLVTLQVSWPAAVPPQRATGCVQAFVALDRN